MIGHQRTFGADEFLTKPIGDERLIDAVAAPADRTRRLNAQMIQDCLTGQIKHTGIKKLLAWRLRGSDELRLLAFATTGIDQFKASTTATAGKSLHWCCPTAGIRMPDA